MIGPSWYGQWPDLKLAFDLAGGQSWTKAWQPGSDAQAWLARTQLLKKPPSESASGVAVSCEATADHLGVVHETLSRFWQELQSPPGDEWRMLFELAVSEIAANIIEHARPPSVHLHIGIQAAAVVAEFTDSGRGWEGPPGPAHVVDQLLERGRGLSLARTALDEMAYERTGLTNRWRLVKRLEVDEPAELQLG